MLHIIIENHIEQMVIELNQPVLFFMDTINEYQIIGYEENKTAYMLLRKTSFPIQHPKKIIFERTIHKIVKSVIIGDKKDNYAILTFAPIKQ